MQIVRVAELPKKDQDFRKIDADVRQRVVDRARAAEETVLFPGDTFEDLSVELRSPADSSHTHCEASLMALIVDKDPDLIVPQVVSQWPVGVSKKCCWTCWKLRELLAPTFVMSGTHRIVYGWVPPPGLSVEVLTGLRDALLEAYGDACQTELEMSRRSAQTSPASPNFGTDMTVMFPSSHK
ncbi:hypothetical protein B0H11DRAFT_616434 [Mycena galericulata]|nr:hypothetical protein B0H11DRAFT_616434 [Mycena galericulata]